MKNYDMIETSYPLSVFGFNAPIQIKGFKDVGNPLVPALNPYYVFRKEVLRDVVDFIDESFGDGLMLFGDTGCGKTSFVEQVCARLHIPVYSHTCGENDRFETFVGRWDLIKGETVWVDGILTKAMKTGGICLLNEMDFLLPSEFAQFNGVLEGAPLIIDQLGGEVVIPKKGFRLIATSNSCGSGDISGRYQGVNMQNMASLDRFISVHCEYPDAAVEQDIIEKICPQLPIDIIEKMIRLANIVRGIYSGKSIDQLGDTDAAKASVDNDLSLSVTFSTRTLIRWGTRTVRMHSPDNPSPLKYALTRSLLNRIPEKCEREGIESLAIALFGEAYDPELATRSYDDDLAF